MQFFCQIYMEMLKRIKTGKITPISLGIVFVLESSIIIKRIAQIINVAKIAPKLKSETFKKGELIGTKKKIIIIKEGTKNGWINIR